MRIPRLGDAPSPATFSTGMLARGYPTVAHQLPSPCESRYFSDFGHDRHRRDLSDSPQGLQSLDHCAHLRWCQLHRFFDRQVQPGDAQFRVLHLMQVIEQVASCAACYSVIFVQPRDSVNLNSSPNIQTSSPVPNRKGQVWTGFSLMPGEENTGCCVRPCGKKRPPLLGSVG